MYRVKGGWRMPRVGGDGGGGAEKAGGSGFGGWLGGAARAMTGGSVGGGYVVLGGTRYGLRLSQVKRISFSILLLIVYLFFFKFSSRFTRVSQFFHSNRNSSFIIKKIY